MMVPSQEERMGKQQAVGSKHYRAFIGPPEYYDRISAIQFNLLTFLGLREHHHLLDIGCGSLRGGKLFIPYLLPERYFGIEPEQWLVDDGINLEIGKDQIAIKQPRFSNSRDFTLSVFNQQFDFILAQSIFSHASQSQIRRCLAEAVRVMKPGALFVANYAVGNADYTDDAWVYPDGVTDKSHLTGVTMTPQPDGAEYTSEPGGVMYTPQRMSALAEEQGLFCQPIHWPHPNGLSWIVLVRPEDRDRIPSMSDDLPALQRELELTKLRLAEIQGHPAVALGLRVNRLLRKGLRRVRGSG